MIASAHIDTFTRDNLPPRNQWPEFLLAPDLDYPERLNCISELLDRWVENGEGDRPCLISPNETLTYAQLAERVNRIANVLTRDFGLVPGNRVLLRGPNNPMMVASILAVIKAGGVVVATMPLLRAKELSYAAGKAKIALALCDMRLADEMEKTKPLAPGLKQIVYWGDASQGSLESLMMRPGYENFHRLRHRKRRCLPDRIHLRHHGRAERHDAFPSRYARDLRHLWPSRAACRPPTTASSVRRRLLSHSVSAASCCFRCASVRPRSCWKKRRRMNCLPAIAKWRATICFTAPTAYRAMLGALAAHDISSLEEMRFGGRSACRCRPSRPGTRRPASGSWTASARPRCCISSSARRTTEIRAGSTGRVVPGYEAKVIDDAGHEMPPGIPGRLAVRGPTGCRYLADTRQTVYVQSGWNVTGDTYVMDKDRYFWYQARSDDMIISAGYNIAGPEVETVLLTHPAVAECGVCRSARRGTRTHRQGLYRLAAGREWLRRDDQDIAGFRESRDRALQISARDRVCRLTAAHADRQAAAFRVAQDRA